MTNNTKNTSNNLLTPIEVWSSKIYSNSWKKAGSGTAEVIEKATGATLGQIGIASAEDISAAAASAREAQKEWAKVPGPRRGDVLREFSRLLLERSSVNNGCVCLPPHACGEKSPSALRPAQGMPETHSQPRPARIASVSITPACWRWPPGSRKRAVASRVRSVDAVLRSSSADDLLYRVSCDDVCR